MAKKVKRPGRVKVNRRKSAKTGKSGGAANVAAEMLPKLPADAAREQVWEVAKSQVQEFLHQHGLSELEDQINACREELKLHRLEVQQRTEAMQMGENTTTRWQVAPGVACKIRDQLSKYESRKHKLEKDSREYFAAVMAWYDLSPDGQKLPEPEKLAGCVSARQNESDHQNPDQPEPKPETPTDKPILHLRE